MKHFRKVSAVLLAILMVAVTLPSFLSFESAPVEAAEVGAVTNGNFDTGDATGWDMSEWSISITNNSSYRRSGYGARISGAADANAVLLTQVIPVNTNATYTFSFYAKAPKTGCDYIACYTYSLDLGTTAGTCNNSLVSQATVNTGSSSWTQITYTVNTGSYKYLQIRFIAVGNSTYDDSAIDDVALSTVNAGDTGTHAAPSLVSFATEYNRPASDSDNIIVQPGFESTTNAQWNTTNFLKQGVSIETDASIAHSGSKYLKYYHGTVGYTDWPMFEITCPTAGEYVFSAWVRTPHLSANNKGAASIGVIDRDTGKFLTYSKVKDGTEQYYGHYSTPEIQIRSTATDDNWHLRSVVFYVGAANSNVNIGMYGLASTMYVDDISVHLLTKGVKYEGNQKGDLSVSSTSVTNKFCESEDNLIADCNMSGQNAVDFWSQTSGWNNGFLNFQQDPQSSVHGNALHFKGTNPGSDKLYNYIKWVYVEPNTSYTVSFDYRVAAAGNQLMFVDNNIESPQVFHTPDLGSASNTWKTYAFTFSTGNYNRIGIVLRDHASAELYLDDIRFFKTSDGISTEPEEEVFPTLRHEEEVKESRMEMENGKYGLAFLFELQCDGVTRQDDPTLANKFYADYTNGTVEAFEDGVEYKLIKAGAVMTNDETVGENASIFTLDNVQSDLTVIDVLAEKLFYNTDAIELNGVISYAVRITNIPESHTGTLIYARPYYIFEYNGRQITVYSDIVCDSYEAQKDINDGSFSDWE